MSVWIARRANVVLGEEWDNALEICADYLDAAGDSDEEIAAALIEIADAIGGAATVGITHIVGGEPPQGNLGSQPSEVASATPSDDPIDEPDGESDDSPEEPVAAEPPGESDNAENQNDVRTPEPGAAIMPNESFAGPSGSLAGGEPPQGNIGPATDKPRPSASLGADLAKR